MASGWVGPLNTLTRWEIWCITLWAVNPLCQVRMRSAHSLCIHYYNLATMGSLWPNASPLVTHSLFSWQGWWRLAPLSPVSPLPGPILPWRHGHEHSAQQSWKIFFHVTSCQRSADGLILHCGIRITRNVIMEVVHINNPYTQNHMGARFKIWPHQNYMTTMLYLLFLWVLYMELTHLLSYLLPAPHTSSTSLIWSGFG